MSQDTTGQRWRVAKFFRATIKDVVIGAVGVAILALPLFSLDIVVNDFNGLFGRETPLPHWVALPVILAWAVAAGIYIAACNVGILPRLGIGIMLIATGIAAVFAKIMAAFALGAALFVLPALMITMASGGFLIVAGAALWLVLFLFGPMLVAALLGAELSF
ncbi:hypothetical protein [Paracoccus sp. Ld10]|uniref:hypothetical protein n=1 Tax=Paracoccus sp. Ld10 TaxID=649158 RepID=UPI003867196B